MGWLHQAWTILKNSVTNFINDNAMMLAAALAFYLALSLAPLLLLIMAFAGLFLGPSAHEAAVTQTTQLLGEGMGQVVQTVLQNSKQPGLAGISAILGLLSLLLSATGFFAQLQASMNLIWDVEGKPGQGIWGYLRKRFASLVMILVVSLLLLLSLLIGAVISSATTLLEGQVPGGPWLWEGLNVLVSILMFFLFFAAIFKLLPDVKIKWHDVWVGALLTAVLFALGKLGIGLYLGRSGTGSAFGAAGSLILLLVWVYYSAVILFMGAELTQSYAKARGSQIVPDRHARRLGHKQMAGDEPPPARRPPPAAPPPPAGRAQPA